MIYILPYFLNSHTCHACEMFQTIGTYIILEDKAPYAGFLLAPAESFGLWPRLFLAGQKKTFFTLFMLILGHYWFLVVTSVTFNNFENHPKNQKIFLNFFLKISNIEIKKISKYHFKKNFKIRKSKYTKKIWSFLKIFFFQAIKKIFFFFCNKK